MKRTTQGVVTAVRQFVHTPDGPVALVELTDIGSGAVEQQLALLSNAGEMLSWEPAQATFSTPDWPGSGSFGSVTAAGVAFASIGAAARSLEAKLSLAAPDGIIELATNGEHVLALEAEPALHDGTRQRLHLVRLLGSRAETQRSPDLAPLRLSAHRCLTGLACMGGRFFAMVADPMAGLDIFVLTPAEAGSGFQQVVERGGERYMLNGAVSAVASVPGGLLVGTAALADANLRIGSWGPELLLLPHTGGWDLVIGQPRLTAQGLQIPASGQMPGLGQPANAAIKAIATGSLGGGTGTWIVMQQFAGRSVASRSVAQPDMFAYRGTARLFVSSDLVAWRSVPLALPDGIGAVTALHVTPRAILIGHEGAGARTIPVTVLPR